MTSSSTNNNHEQASSHEDSSKKKKASSPNMNKRAKKVKKPTTPKPSTTTATPTNSGTITSSSTTSSSPSTPGNSSNKSASSKCQVCGSSAETSKNFMLTCKTCGHKIHLNCYDNDHLSKKFAKDWECVECKSCEVCKKSTYDADNQILICNRCDRGYHQNCCTGRFRNIPTGDKPWFCEECWTYLSEKKKKKKRKTDEPAQQEAPQQNEEGSLFELKPIEEQQQVSKLSTTPEPTDSALQNGGAPHAPLTTEFIPEIPATKIIHPEIINTTTNVVPLGTAALEPVENNAKINVFVVFTFEDKLIYSSQMMIDNISHGDQRSSIALNYFKNLKHYLIQRLKLKLEDTLVDEDCDDEIRAVFLVQKFGIRRLVIKERDRFGTEIRIEIDRWYFEVYKLKDGDTIFVELTLKPTTQGSLPPSSSTHDDGNGFATRVVE
ncbi:hypothetical protein FDP41_013654 [Naegleria fowleri]|uniref:PHD-type domain-containing protein n=1 Tax=Naegleria fowleri TaxID=5763 RepID=A0A6A5C3K2_NAEFO|nr:uncharacterized protein FDP41_013654 [Naegleria fowleri]KAF0980440.1 hypothetical protein FDP41_013654 [Naegleria fowleri]CAG4712158.1 unnamed protein product [Naegleria fowleri]